MEPLSTKKQKVEYKNLMKKKIINSSTFISDDEFFHLIKNTTSSTTNTSSSTITDNTTTSSSSSLLENSSERLDKEKYTTFESLDELLITLEEESFQNEQQLILLKKEKEFNLEILNNLTFKFNNKIYNLKDWYKVILMYEDYRSDLYNELYNDLNNELNNNLESTNKEGSEGSGINKESNYKEVSVAMKREKCFEFVNQLANNYLNTFFNLNYLENLNTLQNSLQNSDEKFISKNNLINYFKYINPNREFILENRNILKYILLKNYLKYIIFRKENNLSFKHLQQDILNIYESLNLENSLQNNLQNNNLQNLLITTLFIKIQSYFVKEFYEIKFNLNINTLNTEYYNSLLYFYSNNNLFKMENILKEMTNKGIKRNDITTTILIQGYLNYNKLNKIIKILQNSYNLKYIPIIFKKSLNNKIYILSEHLLFNYLILNNNNYLKYIGLLLTKYTQEFKYEEIEKIFNYIKNEKIVIDNYIFNLIVNSFLKRKYFKMVNFLFKLYPNLVTTGILNYYYKEILLNKYFNNLLEIYKNESLQKHYNEITYTFLIKIFILYFDHLKIHNLRNELNFLQNEIENLFQSIKDKNLIICTCMMEFYLKINDLDKIEYYFKISPEKDIKIINTMLNAYIKNDDKDLNKSFLFFKSIENPITSTFNILLKGLIKFKHFNLADDLLLQFNHDDITHTTMLNGYIESLQFDKFNDYLNKNINLDSLKTNSHLCGIVMKYYYKLNNIDQLENLLNNFIHPTFPLLEMSAKYFLNLKQSEKVKELFQNKVIPIFGTSSYEYKKFLSNIILPMKETKPKTDVTLQEHWVRVD
ncbi:hypothetical protein ABK040_015075 [Willaertia magna]